ncbi:SRPBCC family protein [Robertkochia solimangrovi]|uniref:SRPBCC family protein n=1 Tax=Robertkochia solimangrovi TaxID=2213046 RepID=UPI0011802D78|nr:SRPBCC family protein [Robertkochia solimangrovi]TRZ43478.1 cell division inhibitor [Robertkochia solimangrovi]
MKIYRIHCRQELKTDLKTAWEFLSNPKNLCNITPDHMKFEIVSGAEKEMYAGQLIQYVVCPFPWMKTRWVTEITHVQEGSFFVDEQRFGPFRLWHHKHFLAPSERGVVMEDIVDYKIPFGYVGQLANHLIVGKQVKMIFDYRQEKLAALFGTP